MNIVKIKLIRFILIVIFYAIILISTATYTYSFQPGLFALKDFLVPYNGILILCVVISVVFAIMNEIITMLAIRYLGGHKQND